MLKIDNQIVIQELKRIRQHIHQYPELGFDVNNTATYISKELEKLNLEIRKGIGKTGLIADLKVSSVLKTIALRANIDTLPINEPTFDLSNEAILNGAKYFTNLIFSFN